MTQSGLRKLSARASASGGVHFPSGDIFNTPLSMVTVFEGPPLNS